MRDPRDATTALILCGGRATRMGGVDKPLQAFLGRPLVEHVLGRIAPQTGGRVLISANRHPQAYARFGHPVLADTLPDFPGPLAGILAGLEALEALEARDADAWMLCVSGDSPWLPHDLLERLVTGLSTATLPPSPPPSPAPRERESRPRDAHGGAPDCAMALGREGPGQPLRSQPLASLIHVRHREALEAALRAGERRVEAWLRTLPLALVAFDRPQDERAFANINDRSELERLERLEGLR
jgi:molybdopterin-guanine dinucleotide biosynthesis protein A